MSGTPMSDSEHLDRLAELALEMVERVRDVDPGRNAAMVDPNATVSMLLGWTWQYADRGEQMWPAA